MMKNLNNLSPAPGSNRPTKRLGRGIGSGLGKTAGKGHKGQKARKSGGIRAGFEGGQTPLYRRLPKFGFSRVSTLHRIIKTLDLRVFSEGTTVDREALVREKIIPSTCQRPIKLLLQGEVQQKLLVSVDKVSLGARKAIELSGGSIEGA